MDLDHLVSDMLERGPGEVPCPQGLSRHDFDSIRLIIDKVTRMYGPLHRNVPWQPGLQKGNPGSLMDLLKDGGYSAAHGYLAVEADFIPA